MVVLICIRVCALLAKLTHFNQVLIVRKYSLLEFYSLIGFAWQVWQTDGSVQRPSILARNFLEASF